MIEENEKKQEETKGRIRSSKKMSKSDDDDDDDEADDSIFTDFFHGEGRFSFWSELRSFFTIMSFITRLPGPIAFKADFPHPGFVMKGIGAYICLVGTLIGIVVVVIFDVLHVTLDLPLIIAICWTIVIYEFFMTGCFHSDGLADTADGIGGGWTTKKILHIMSDSRLGTFGCAAYCLYTMTKIHLLQELGTSQWNIIFQLQRHGVSSSSSSHGAGPAILVSQTLSRLSAPYLIRTRDYIDDSNGPKTEFYSFFEQAKHLVSWSRVLVSITTCLLVTGFLYGPVLAVLLVTIVLCASHFVAGSYADYWLGGVMGDYLGATICCTELLCLTLLLWVDMHQEFLQEYIFTAEKLISWWPLEFIQHDKETSILTRFHHPYSTIWKNICIHESVPESVMALARFLVVAMLLSIWCCNVGHERKMLRDWPEESPTAPTDKNENSNGTVHNVQNVATTVPSSDLSPKEFAQATLALPTCTFSERYHAVQSYINTLAKPVGSLGTLEDWAARLAALQRTIRPTANPVACLIFAADHGAARAVEHGGEACSLYPPAVTQSILQGLQRGIAGASILAKAHQVTLRVVDVGVAFPSDNNNNDDGDGDTLGGAKASSSLLHDMASDDTVRSSVHKLVGGTRNLCTQAAMTLEECERCIQMGREEFANYVDETKACIVALGEVGIGNTTASSALIAHFTKAKVESVCGSGATTASQSANDASIHKKVQLVKKALKLHGNAIKKSKIDPPAKEALARLGGAEIAALVGAMLEAAERGNIAILVDGFIVTAAALVAMTIQPLACSRILFLTTHSAEKGHDVAIASIQQLASGSTKENGTPVLLSTPALNMNLRMGEATAALLAVPLIRSAAAMLSEMGTIEDILSGETSEKG